MPSIINADNGIASGSVGLKYSSDNSGVLALQSNNNTIISASNTLTTISSTAVGIGTNNPEMRVDVNGGVRVQSITNPTSGSGMELAYDGTQGIIQAYSNRATLTPVPVYLVTGQLRFPPTQNSSSDANTLDDYEEGTWTPVITNGTTNVTSYYWQLGYYVKIGKNVFVSMQVSVNVVGPISGNIRIDGLPFVSANPAGYNEYSLFGSKYSPTTGAVIYRINGGDNKFFPSFVSSYPTQLTSSDLGSGGQWVLQGWYITTS